MLRAAALAVTAAFAVAACAPAVEPRGPDQANVRDEAKAVQGSRSRLDLCPSTGEAVTGDERLPALSHRTTPGPGDHKSGTDHPRKKPRWIQAQGRRVLLRGHGPPRGG